jgi:galactokinase
VPLGSGLSSSAALEVVTAFGMLAVSAIELSRVEMARFCQRAENEVVGVRCGIMDQLASACGAADRALLLDCRSLEYELQPLPEQARLVIANTMVRHDLAAGEYNRRRAECEEAVAHLARRLPGVKALRDVTPAQLEQHGEGLAERPRKRARHVVAENERVAQASEALRGGDIARFGQLMAASHNSLRDDYEVSCKELDLMVGFANEVGGVYGSRMTGGGFGGCTISLVAHDRVAEFERHVVPRYRRATGFHPWIYTCSAVDGAEEVGVAEGGE